MSKPSVDSLFGIAEAPADSDSDPDLYNLAKRVLACRAKEDEAKAAYEDARNAAQNAENVLLRALEQAKLKSVRLPSGELLTITSKVQYSLPNKDMEEQRHEVMVWLRRCGLGSMVEEAIHQSTLTKVCRERVEQGKDINPLIKQFVQQTLSVRKA